MANIMQYLRFCLFLTCYVKSMAQPTSSSNTRPTGNTSTDCNDSLSLCRVFQISHHHSKQHIFDETKYIFVQCRRNPDVGLVVFWVTFMQRGYFRYIIRIKAFPFHIKCVQMNNGQEVTKCFGFHGHSDKLTIFEVNLTSLEIQYKLISSISFLHNGRVKGSYRKDHEHSCATHTFYSFEDFSGQSKVYSRRGTIAFLYVRLDDVFLNRY